MFRKVIIVLLGLALTAGAACGSASTAGTSPSPAEPSSSPSPSASPTLVSYDPCVLLPPSEATALTGISYSAGREDVANALKECIYGYQTTDVLILGVAQAPDVATAQAYEAAAQADLQKAGAIALNVTQIQGVGDSAAQVQTSGTIGGGQINVCGIYVLKGATFFTISDVALNRAVPSSDTMQKQALTVLGRL